MKKVLMSVLTLTMLSGCATYYDYYKSGVRYTQDGDDCVFYNVERGRFFSDEISLLDVDKKIVYQNAKCETLYKRDMMLRAPHHHRPFDAAPVKKSGGCKKACKYIKVK